MDTLEKIVLDSQQAHKMMKEIEINGAEARWHQKPIHESLSINLLNFEKVKLGGSGTLALSSKFSHSGQSTLCLSTRTDITDARPRPTSSVQINEINQDWSRFNRISVWVYPESTGFQNFYFHFYLQNRNTRGRSHAPCLIPNRWNHITWELTHFDHNDVLRLSMGPLLLGCPPEAKPEVNFYFDALTIERVDADDVLGWECDNRIAYCHSGYFLDAQKVALTQGAKDNRFSLLDENDHFVYSNAIQDQTSDIGQFQILDFSPFKEKGRYRLSIDGQVTPLFDIDNQAYHSSIWKSINFLNMLRCGDDVPGVHSPCHLNCYTTHPDGRMLANHGGWHDAGDVSQFEICTAEMAHALLDLAEVVQPKDKQLADRLLEEARWGVLWLLRTRFEDGYRALAIHYSIWRKNILEKKEMLNDNGQGQMMNVAENGPFENFCAAACEAKAAAMFQTEDAVFADWCLRSAIEDFWFAVEGHKQGIYTRRWGPGAEAQVCGEGALAAAELFAITHDEAFLNQGVAYAKIVLSCQQQTFPAWDFPIRGFFFEDPAHTKMLTYEHRGHEQTPLHGLRRLCEVASNHPEATNWMEGLRLYGEYISSTAHLIDPYGLIPGHVYIIGTLNLDRFTVPPQWGTPEEVINELHEQIKTGIRLHDNVYLRRLPIAIQRRGYHATLLSKTKGITSVATILNDPTLQQIAINQLEWILGKNPFASSTMYGEGYNYHPLYVAFSPQLVGALPVGFETLGHIDAPFWSTINNAVYKEIWGHTTGKYLWVLSDVLKHFSKV